MGFFPVVLFGFGHLWLHIFPHVWVKSLCELVSVYLLYLCIFFIINRDPRACFNIKNMLFFFLFAGFILILV